MPGPLPKDPELRQRRNRVATEAELDATPHQLRIPPLPKALFGSLVLHPLTRRWWRVIWRSPMAPRWLEADIEGLYLVAVLRNQFFHDPSARLAAEVRQQEARFGLDVMGRRRLDWRIAGPARQPEAPSKPEPTTPPEPDGFDPRSVLRAV